MDLPQRRKLRLKGHDYNRNGMYFVTICTANRLPLFGEITDGIMHCNDNGLIVQANIDKLNHLYQGVAVNHSVIMPDHVHLMITVCRERILCVPNADPTKSQLSRMIQAFKASITKEIRARDTDNTFSVVWQSHFYDHIIRDEAEYQKIWQYIDTNPMNWEKK